MGVMATGIAASVLLLTIVVLSGMLLDRSLEVRNLKESLRYTQNDRDWLLGDRDDYRSKHLEKLQRIEELEKALADQVEAATLVAENRDYWKRGLHEANRRLHNFVKIRDSMNAAVADSKKPY